jgi:abortive infection bacteriophage resistance protein
VRFIKQPSSVDQQIVLLRNRGMAIPDDAEAVRYLDTIGYYRLSAYWLPFEEPPAVGQTRSKQFLPGTEFGAVIAVYVFDRRLRVLLLEGLERVEIHVRSRWTYRMAHQHSAHAHIDSSCFSNGFRHIEMLNKLARTVEKASETFVDHYRSKYTDPYLPPLWAVTELMSLGELSMWYAATRDLKVRDAVARDLGLPTREICDGVLQAMAYVRNICAHHSRLWNRRLVKRMPRIKRLREDMVAEQVKGQNQPANLVYNVIAVLLHLLHRQCTDSTFGDRLRALVETITDEQRAAMGFPPDWRTRPAWNLK